MVFALGLLAAREGQLVLCLVAEAVVLDPKIVPRTRDWLTMDSKAASIDLKLSWDLRNLAKVKKSAC